MMSKLTLLRLMCRIRVCDVQSSKEDCEKQRNKRSNRGIRPPPTLPGHASRAIGRCEAPGTKRRDAGLDVSNRQGESGMVNVT